MTVPPISGYRQLTEQEVSDINYNKGLEVQVATFWRDMNDNPDYDKRMLALSKTYLQQGFMWMNRAISRPFDPFAEDD